RLPFAVSRSSSAIAMRRIAHSGTTRSLSARRSPPSRKGSCSARLLGLRSVRAQFRGRLARLLHAVFDLDRHLADVRLRAVGRRLAHSEDAGRIAGMGPPARPLVLCWCAFGDCARQRSNTGLGAGHRLSLVLLAEHSLLVANTHPDLARCDLGMAVLEQPLRGRPVRGGDRAGSALLHPPHDQPVADDRALQIHVVGSRGVTKHASLPADRRAVPVAHYLDVHGLVVLGVPRQGARRYRLSLKRAAQASRATRGAMNSRNTGDHLACSGPLDEWPISLSISK